LLLFFGVLVSFTGSCICVIILFGDFHLSVSHTGKWV
jgi:hypothetical protein